MNSRQIAAELVTLASKLIEGADERSQAAVALTKVMLEQSNKLGFPLNDEARNFLFKAILSHLPQKKAAAKKGPWSGMTKRERGLAMGDAEGFEKVLYQFAKLACAFTLGHKDQDCVEQMAQAISKAVESVAKL